MRLVFSLGFALLAASSAAFATQLSFDSPGYIAIDGRYYAFGAALVDGLSVPAALHSRDSSGFFLQAFVDAGACVHRNGDVAGLAPSPSGLAHAEVLDLLDAPRIDLGVDGSALSHVTLAVCEGIPVLVADTPGADTDCDGGQPFPFRRGQCPGLDLADHGNVFFDAFETR